MKLSSLFFHRIIPIVLITLALPGCGARSDSPPVTTAGPTDKPTIEPQPIAPDWTLHTLDKEGVALSVPPHWMEFNLGEENVENIMSTMLEANPTFGGAMASQLPNLVAQGIKFIAIDVRSPSLNRGFAESIILARTKRPLALDIDTAAELISNQLKTQYGSALDGEIQTDWLTSKNDQELLSLRYNVVLNMTNGTPRTLSTVQYIGLTESDYYILSGVALDSTIDEYEHFFEEIALNSYFFAPVE